MKRKLIDKDKFNQPRKKKRKFSKQLYNDTSLVYDKEIFCNKLEIPLKNNVHSGILYEKYVRNMKYFSENKKKIVENNDRKWFGVYYENDNPIVKVGRSRRNLMNKCTAGSVISFGTNQDHVFIRKSIKYYRSFSSQNIPKNKNDEFKYGKINPFLSHSHYFVDCELKFLQNDGNRTESVKTIALIDNGSDNLSMSSKCVPSGDLFSEGEGENKIYDVLIKLFGKNNQNLEKELNISLIGSSHQKAEDQGIVLLGNDGFLFETNYFQSFVNDVPTFNILGEDEKATITFANE